MGNCFSDEVERALTYIYYDLRAGKGAEGLMLLQRASDAGDGDASCILARCYCGNQYVWSGHDFPEDDDRAVMLIHRAVEQGSGIGVLVALRTGELTPSLEKKMPFSSLQEAFDSVLEKAQRGDAFCQYTVANSYFWWDFLRIQGKGRDAFSNEKEYKEYLRMNISQCEDWFWKAFRGGMYFAANNLNRFYSEGDEDIIAPRPELAKDLFLTGAQMGYPIHQWMYGQDLEEQKKYEEALHWYKLGAEGGQLECWFRIGRAYELGLGVEKDESYAARCYEKGLTQKKDSGNRIGCANRLGAFYYDGRGKRLCQGVPAYEIRLRPQYHFCGLLSWVLLFPGPGYAAGLRKGQGISGKGELEQQGGVLYAGRDLRTGPRCAGGYQKGRGVSAEGRRL